MEDVLQYDFNKLIIHFKTGILIRIFCLGTPVKTVESTQQVSLGKSSVHHLISNSVYKLSIA